MCEQMYDDRSQISSTFIMIVKTTLRALLFVCTFYASIRHANGKGDLVSTNFNAIEDTYPTNCHVCRFLAEEVYIFLNRTKSHDTIQIGSEFQKSLRKIKYNKSELRLTEAVEEACQKMLEYKVHKDRPIRYARGESNTFQALNDLRNRGVKVDLGFPYEMWDDPDREVQLLKLKCERLVEQYEDELSEWYYNHQAKNLTQWLCDDKVLQPKEKDCLEISPHDVFKDLETKEKTENYTETKRSTRKSKKYTTKNRQTS